MNIWFADNPYGVLNKQLSLPVGSFVPTKVIRVCHKDRPWFDDDCRHLFDLMQDAHLRWSHDRSPVNWDEFVRCQMRARELYVEAGPPFDARIMQGCSDERPVAIQVRGLL